MTETATQGTVSDIDIQLLHSFLLQENERLNTMRENIVTKIGDNWHRMATYDAADFVEIVGMQAALSSLTAMVTGAIAQEATNVEIRDEWQRMSERKLREFAFVPTNSSQVVNLARSYEGAFWARAADQLVWLAR